MRLNVTGMSLLVLGAALLILPACSVHEPHGLYDTRLQAVKGFEEDLLPLSALDSRAVRLRANHYEKFGNGPMLLTVTFNPHSKIITASSARKHLQTLEQRFEREGVRDIKSDLLAVNDNLDEARVMISYATVRAEQPKGCEERMPGLHDTNVESNAAYKFGCGTDTIFARQIAKPRHLIGNDDGADTTSEGRRAANIVETYRSGAPNVPLDGESASGE